MKKSSKKIYLFPVTMLGITAISGSIAMMTNVSADDLPSIDDNITITVDSACTIGQTVTSSHTTELNPGETNNTIGQSRIAAYCNDNEGYAIYAIGYTNSEYGNTNLVSTDGVHTIPTGTSGSSSYWNMKLTQGAATGPTSYLPTMVNEFTTNATIPNDYTKVAYRDSSTISQNQDPTETGSYFTSTYEAHIDTTQPAGIYNGRVQYVMVHPSSAPAPEKPKPPLMQKVFEWKDELLPNIGDTVQAMDARDEKAYWVTKLADGNIWMTQNLDLDIKAGRTYTSADTDLANSTIGTTWTPSVSTSTTSSWTSSNFDPYSYDPGNLYWDGNIDASYSGTLSTNTVIDPSATSGGTHYHVGNYYNWTAAVAMNDSSSYTPYTDANQSICPAGWRLPTYSDDKSYDNLVNAQGLNSGTNGNIQLDPTYFVYGGLWSGFSDSVGGVGCYRPGVLSSSNSTYILYFTATALLNPYARGDRSSGVSVRCVVR